MIRVTGYGVIAEKPRVGKLGQFVRTPVGKTIRRIEKWMTTYSMGTTSSYQHAKFGEDRTTRSGCRCENVVFVFFYRQDAAKRQTAGITACTVVQAVV